MDVLCSDKTGTLTLNKLTVDKNLIEVRWRMILFIGFSMFPSCAEGNFLFVIVSELMYQVFSKGVDADAVLLMAARASRTENQDAIDTAIVGMLADPKEVNLIDAKIIPSLCDCYAITHT